MTDRDEEMEGSVSSLLIDSLKSNTNENLLSPEDLAWVDSCLVKDPEVSDSEWGSLKNALVNVLTLQHDSDDFVAPESNGFSRVTNIKMLPSSEAGIMHSSDEAGSEDDGKEETSIMLSELFQGDLSETYLRNAFQPHYVEGDQRMSVSESISSELEVGFSAYEEETSTADIFKVWDLGISNEEEEEEEEAGLVKQLNKALSEGTVQLTPSAADDSQALKDLKVESVDDLIAGIADLSLDQNSS